MGADRSSREAAESAGVGRDRWARRDRKIGQSFIASPLQIADFTIADFAMTGLATPGLIHGTGAPGSSLPNA